jgi:hypothetical protein
MNLQELVHEIAVEGAPRLGATAELSSRRRTRGCCARPNASSGARAIRAANAQDVAEARAKGVEAPLADRLELSDAKWRDMIAGCARSRRCPIRRARRADVGAAERARGRAACGSRSA